MSESKQHLWSVDLTEKEIFEWPYYQNIEVSNLILQRHYGQMITFGALTDTGWPRTTGVECAEEYRERLLPTLKLLESQRREPKKTSLIFPDSLQASETHTTDVPESHDWVDSPEVILEAIRKLLIALKFIVELRIRLFWFQFFKH